MNRFKIIDPSGRRTTTTHKTINEVIKMLNSSSCDIEWQTYYIECSIDEIQITSDELLDAWNNGERPDDLQMF